jgi:ribosomal protein L15E
MCGKPIPVGEDGQGKHMFADVLIHHPKYPAIRTEYKSRWICHLCVKLIANNVADNDAGI